MSTGGHIWKNKNDFNIAKTVRDIELAAERGGYEVRIDRKFQKGDDHIYTNGNVANIYADVSWSRQLRLIIQSYSYMDGLYIQDHVKDGYLPAGRNMGEVIFIEEVSDCEPVLLHFLYEYLKLNQEDVFFTDFYRWYFTYKDIERIIPKNRIDSSWYCKNPALKNVDYWGRTIEISGNRRVFERKVMQVCKHENHYIVQHGSGYDIGIRNIYCLDEHANIVWQFENLFERYPDAEKQGINNMQIKDGVIIATDLSRKNKYYINIETGEAEKQIRWVNGKQEIIPYPFSDNNG